MLYLNTTDDVLAVEAATGPRRVDPGAMVQIAAAVAHPYIAAGQLAAADTSLTTSHRAAKEAES